MANVYAVASGNWSNTATWNTGALPTAADDVFSNNFTVTVDQNIDVLSLRNTASAPIVAGGGFTFSVAGITASITGATPLAVGGANLLTFSHNTGTVSANFTNNITLSLNAISPLILYSGNGNLDITCPNSNISAAGASPVTYINKNGGGTFTLNSNITFTQSGNSTNALFFLNSSNGNNIINGNISQPGTGTTTNFTRTISQSAGTLTITGNVTAPVVFLNSVQTINFTGTLLTINGNLLASVGNNVLTTAAATITGDIYGNSSTYGINTTNALTVNGNVYGGNANAIVSTTGAIVVNGNVNGGSVYGINAGAGIITITGNVTATTTAGAVFTTGTTIINGTITNASNGRMAVWSSRLFLNPSITSMTLYTIGSLTPKVLYSEDAFPNAPAAADVREGITYGVGGTLLGTLAMPSPSDVRSGVATDATIGSGLFTTDTLLSEISSSSEPVAVRMRDAGTTEILGSLLAAYKQ